MTATNLEKLAAEVEDLTPADKLRLAAGLLEGGSAKLAHTLVERVSLELGAWLALQAKRREPRP